MDKIPMVFGIVGVLLVVGALAIYLIDRSEKKRAAESSSRFGRAQERFDRAATRERIIPKSARTVAPPPHRAASPATSNIRNDDDPMNVLSTLYMTGAFHPEPDHQHSPSHTDHSHDTSSSNDSSSSSSSSDSSSSSSSSDGGGGSD